MKSTKNLLASLVAMLALVFCFAAFATEAKASCTVNITVLTYTGHYAMSGVTTQVLDASSVWRDYATTQSNGGTGTGYFGSGDYDFRVPNQNGYYFVLNNNEQVKTIACDDNEAFYITFYGIPL